MSVENFDIWTRKFCEPGQAVFPQNRVPGPMTEISISIRADSDRLSPITSISVSVSPLKACETRAPRFVESQLGDGPLLPDSVAISGPSDAFIISVRSDFGR